MTHTLFESAEKKILVDDTLPLGERAIFLLKPEYRFYLRFAKKLFTPCPTCQKDIVEYWSKVSIIDSRVQFALYGGPKEYFFESSSLMLADEQHKDTYDFHYKPCKECQKELKEILDMSDLIFGNSEYTPTIEFARRWDFDPYKPLAEVMKSPNNAFVQEKCMLCGHFFEAAMKYIYELKDIKGAYLCYTCGKKQEKGNK